MFNPVHGVFRERKGDVKVYRFHYDLDHYGLSVPGLYLFGFYHGVGESASVNATERNLSVTISNLVIREKLEHLITDEWFKPYKRGLEDRIASQVLKAKLKESLGKSIAENEGTDGTNSTRELDFRYRDNAMMP